MHALHPGVSPILVLPLYLLQHQPVWLGSVAMGGIFLSLIGSIGGLSLGIGTMVSKDILSPWLKIKSNRGLLRLNRLVVLGVMFCACGFALLHQDSQILFWNYLSMALRGGGIFLPLSLAIFCPGRVGARRAVLSMLLSTCLLYTSLPITRPGKTSSSYRRWRTGTAWWPGQPAPVKRSP